jgi:hypothetical protein
VVERPAGTGPGRPASIEGESVRWLQNWEPEPPAKMSSGFSNVLVEAEPDPSVQSSVKPVVSPGVDVVCQLE